MARAEELTGTAPAHGGLTPGERITLRRSRVGLTREQLGAEAGVSAKTIGRYERDEKEPTASTLGRLALALLTTTDYLVGLRDDPEVPAPDSTTRVWFNGRTQASQA
jgi:transcriptional regulator with XRE-family HTH domain